MSLIFGFIVGFILASYLFFFFFCFALKTYEFVEKQIKNILNKKNKNKEVLESEAKDTNLENESKAKEQ